MYACMHICMMYASMYVRSTHASVCTYDLGIHAFAFAPSSSRDEKISPTHLGTLANAPQCSEFTRGGPCCAPFQPNGEIIELSTTDVIADADDCDGSSDIVLALLAAVGAVASAGCLVAAAVVVVTALTDAVHGTSTVRSSS